MRTHALAAPAPLHPQAGVSMVEVMVAMTLGLFILGSIALTLSNTVQSRVELDRSLQQIENSRYATQILAQDLRHAGYYGRYVGALPAPALLPDPCATDLAALEAGMALPVQGYDDPPTVPAGLDACLSSADHVPGTDILVIRRAAAGQTVAVADAAPGQIYLQTTAYPNGPQYVLSDGATPAAFSLKERKADGSGATVPAPLLPYRVHIYFVSPCDIPAAGDTCTGTADDEGRPIPTLKRLELSVDGVGAPVMRKVPLVEGVENLQFDYGLDQPTAGASTGDGSPETYTEAPPGLADWGNVVAIQLNLLAVNTEPSAGFVDTKSYTLGLAGTVGPFNDAYKRHALSTLVRINNVGGPREE